MLVTLFLGAFHRFVGWSTVLLYAYVCTSTVHSCVDLLNGCTYTYVRILSYVCTYMYVCTYVHTCIRMYIHTYVCRYLFCNY